MTRRRPGVVENVGDGFVAATSTDQRQVGQRQNSGGEIQRGPAQYVFGSGDASEQNDHHHALRRAILAVLNQPRYQQASARVAAEMAAAPGFTGLAGIIDRLVAGPTHRPPITQR